MARAVIANIRNLVYEYLRVNTQGSYGTYLSNQRYPSAYIDDEIYSADLEIVTLLMKNNQDVLLQELHETSALTSGAALPNYHVIKVVVDVLAATGKRAIEITEDQYNILRDGGVVDTASYINYFSIFDGRIYNPIDEDMTITYIELNRDATIKSPEGFESVVADLAAARMLWNRDDRPAQAQEHYRKAVAFMAQYGIEMKGFQQMVDDKK